MSIKNATNSTVSRRPVEEVRRPRVETEVANQGRKSPKTVQVDQAKAQQVAAQSRGTGALKGMGRFAAAKKSTKLMNPEQLVALAQKDPSAAQAELKKVAQAFLNSTEQLSHGGYS